MKRWILSLLLMMLSLASWGAGCSISLPTGDLGGYEPSVNDSGIAIQQAFWVTCPIGTPFVISAGPSQTSGLILKRQMKNTFAGGLLLYQMCHDYPGAGYCNRVFGNGTDGEALSATATGVQQGMYFWIYVFGKQMVEGGEYVDYVSISINP